MRVLKAGDSNRFPNITGAKAPVAPVLNTPLYDLMIAKKLPYNYLLNVRAVASGSVKLISTRGAHSTHPVLRAPPDLKPCDGPKC